MYVLFNFAIIYRPLASPSAVCGIARFCSADALVFWAHYVPCRVSVSVKAILILLIRSFRRCEVVDRFF